MSTPRKRPADDQKRPAAGKQRKSSKAKASKKPRKTPKARKSSPGKMKPSAAPDHAPAARMLRSRPPMERVKRIGELLRARGRLKASTLGKMLSVSYRTIARDIVHMQDSLGTPIEQDPKTYEYYLTEDSFTLPSAELTISEVAVASLAKRALTSFKGTNLGPMLDKFLEKLTENADEKSGRLWERLEKLVSFLPSAFLSTLDPGIFAQVLDLLLGAEEFTLQYGSHTTPGLKAHTLQPLHLTFLEEWYLFAYDLGSDEIRRFVLSRMKEIQRTGRTFQGQDEFSLEEHLAHSVGIYSGNTPERVRLRVKGVALTLLAERPWHKSQQLTRLPDGTAEVTLDVAITPEFENKVRIWGSKISVLEPLTLRDAMRAELLATLAEY